MPPKHPRPSKYTQGGILGNISNKISTMSLVSYHMENNVKDLQFSSTDAVHARSDKAQSEREIDWIPKV